jgi:L,D-transpeptidase YbiS
MQRSDSPILFIDLATQTLELRRAGEIVYQFSVSSAAAGIGFEPGSMQTPTGRFQIYAKIGYGAPLGTVFKSRAPTGEIGSEELADDLVQTRILWLDGIEPENANTLGRYIYIHGTNHESTIGTPASHGCIRMRNRDVILLFDAVDTGNLVVIQP